MLMLGGCVLDYMDSNVKSHYPPFWYELRYNQSMGTTPIPF